MTTFGGSNLALSVLVFLETENFWANLIIVYKKNQGNYEFFSCFRNKNRTAKQLCRAYSKKKTIIKENFSIFSYPYIKVFNDQFELSQQSSESLTKSVKKPLKKVSKNCSETF
jgi:hypothetical protein